MGVLYCIPCTRYDFDKGHIHSVRITPASASSILNQLNGIYLDNFDGLIFRNVRQSNANVARLKSVFQAKGRILRCNINVGFSMPGSNPFIKDVTKPLQY